MLAHKLARQRLIKGRSTCAHVSTYAGIYVGTTTNAFKKRTLNYVNVKW